MKTDVINKYNELGELIYRLDDIEENILSIKDLKNHIWLNMGFGLWKKLKKKKK